MSEDEMKIMMVIIAALMIAPLIEDVVRLTAWVLWCFISLPFVFLKSFLKWVLT